MTTHHRSARLLSRVVIPLLLTLPGFGFAENLNPISIDDLVRRAHIPRAALSPSGRFAAYLQVRGNPDRDSYELAVRVADTTTPSRPTTVIEYELMPEEAFDGMYWLTQSAGNLWWLADDLLLFTAKTNEKMHLATWNARGMRKQAIDQGHDRIVLEHSEARPEALTVITTDFVDRPRDSQPVRDRSWRMRDDYRFYGPFRNPRSGRRTRTQRWSLSLATVPQLSRAGDSSEGWELEPEEWPPASTHATGPTHQSYIFDETPSPDRLLVAAVEKRNVTEPIAASRSEFNIVLADGDRSRVIASITGRSARANILRWSADSRSVQYLHVGPRETTLNSVSLGGAVSQLLRVPALLEKPCDYSRPCQIVSKDGRFVLLVRSTTSMPAELVKADLDTGEVMRVDAPNESFADKVPIEARFYDIDDEDDAAWGRLYLPGGQRKGFRYPLVITQYASTPGYAASTGDEVPIPVLTAHGIAVFAMHSVQFNIPSAIGDFRMELNRVRRPLQAMLSVCKRLVAEGIIDPSSVGLTGLSYGAEIAMYAHWNWHGLRALAVATSSWDPSLYFFGGVAYSKQLQARGFPWPNATGLEEWHRLAAGPNARDNLPPLLIQSPDGEQNFTVPTWFQLRRVGAPVEWYEYPAEGHIKRSPANKWWVFQRNLDWFRFWLKNEEDPAPAKASQYDRWRSMRAQWLASSSRNQENLCSPDGSADTVHD